MIGLMADGWFYISSAGLLVSGALFFFLLGQYRAAGDAADHPEAEAAAEPHAPVVRPLYIPDEPAASPKVASISADKPAEKSPAAASPEPKRETATGGVNTAVVYLQNIKSQLEQIHQETRALAQRVDAITSRDEALIDRLGELTQAVAELKGSNEAAAAPAAAPVPAPAEPPAPKRAKKNEGPSNAVFFQKTGAPVASVAEPAVPAAEPVAAVVEPVAPAAEPVAAAPEPEARPAPAEEAPPAPVVLSAPAPEQEPEAGDKPRRGPVWPV